jgi:hypothetical protein
MSQVSQAAECMSCGAPLSGRYCSNCGERAISKHDYSIGHFFELTAESMFHLDGRVLNTFRLLLQQPGVLAEYFLEGRRKPFMGPVQCFVVANFIYLLIQPFTFVTTFTTTMEQHMTQRDWHALATRMIEAKIASSGLTAEKYADQFDHNAHLQAHTLLIILVPLTAVVFIVLFGRSRKFFAEHLVLSFYTNAFFLIWYAMSTWICAVGLRLWLLAGGRFNGDIYEWIIILSIGVPFTVYLYFANRKFFAEPRSVTWIKSILLMLSYLGIITVYRFILFFTTFYAT